MIFHQTNPPPVPIKSIDDLAAYREFEQALRESARADLRKAFPPAKPNLFTRVCDLLVGPLKRAALYLNPKL